jgi:hypothetical protein
MKKLYYPKEWLQSVGYFQSRLDDSVATAIVAESGAYDDLTAAEIALAQAQINLGAAMNYAAARYSAAKATYLTTAAGHMPQLLPPPKVSSGDHGNAKHSDKHSHSSSEHSSSGSSKHSSSATLTAGSSHSGSSSSSSSSIAAAKASAKVSAMDASLQQQLNESLFSILDGAPGHANGSSGGASQGQTGLHSLSVVVVAVVCGAIGMVLGQKVHFLRQHRYTSVL